MSAADAQDKTAGELFEAISDRLGHIEEVRGSKADYLLKLARAYALVAGNSRPDGDSDSG